MNVYNKISYNITEMHFKRNKTTIILITNSKTYFLLLITYAFSTDSNQENVEGIKIHHLIILLFVCSAFYIRCNKGTIKTTFEAHTNKRYYNQPIFVIFFFSENFFHSVYKSIFNTFFSRFLCLIIEITNLHKISSMLSCMNI